jgi:hypothetical protein
MSEAKNEIRLDALVMCDEPDNTSWFLVVAKRTGTDSYDWYRATKGASLIHPEKGEFVFSDSGVELTDIKVCFKLPRVEQYT